METKFSDVTATHSARGVPTYWVRASHAGLQKHTVIRASDPGVLEHKCLVQAQNWNALWEKREAVEKRIQRTFEQKEARRLHIESQKEIAAERTAEAQDLLNTLQTTLTSHIDLDPSLDWESLKDKAKFPKRSHSRPPMLPEPVQSPLPPEPDPTAFRYQVRLSLLDRLSLVRKIAKKAAAEDLLTAVRAEWRAASEAIGTAHQANLDAYAIECKKLDERHALAVRAWKAEKAAYDDEQAKQHANIDAFRARYEAKEQEAIIEYCERVLSNSEYPDCIPREFEFNLNSETGVMLLNCRLPAPDALPRLAEVKYVQTTDTLSERLLSEAQRTRLYDDVIYQITLRTLHELFQSDSVKVLTTIVFNGIVTSTDRSTGNESTACILSVQASRDVFLAINLAKVDPKACFRQLKGVGSSKLHSMTPIAPIMELLRDDPRFVTSYAVADHLGESCNLAAMDWEDFEHLIREIFAKEFSSGGGEVKVTQASRDGGVDAVAFDPDPIRGGKIVIQAKRYAYTVGVSAVRDLYGTVLNEGASKGILVTTSDYGPDAHEFAAGKPLTLLSGSHLLHLLGKHGVSAHIDLVEARKITAERAARV